MVGEKDSRGGDRRGRRRVWVGEAERRRQEARRDSVDYMTMQQILRTLATMGRTQIGEEYNDFRRGRMVPPPGEVYGLINPKEFDDDTEAGNDQIVDGRFHV